MNYILGFSFKSNEKKWLVDQLMSNFLKFIMNRPYFTIKFDKKLDDRINSRLPAWFRKGLFGLQRGGRKTLVD